MLSKSEEALMEIIWQGENPFFKDIVAAYPPPPPAATTIATLLKRMHEKGVIGYKTMGNSRQYFATISKNEYFKEHVGGLIEKFFGNSALQFASFFTHHTPLSQEELSELKLLIEQQIKK
ncbi:MAG: BlaI/MecI/CopY family transcriptional regulator [Bacteroidetes bacterium]|nr:MAG: BlaI/MecI/CopY family transcriptional regulator [Bacteroidota bacterium]